MFETADQLTVESLTEFSAGHGYTDHVSHFDKLFSVFPVRGFLEYGCGFSTAIFLRHCDHVYSIELGTDRGWFDTCCELLDPAFSNWTRIHYPGTPEILEACGWMNSQHTDPVPQYGDTYIHHLVEQLRSQLKTAEAAGYPIDLAFVDPGVYIRGDLVEICLQQHIPIVALHDAAFQYGLPKVRSPEKNVYGLFKIKEHPLYTRVFINSGTGTAFWIHKEFCDVIKTMQQYAAANLHSADN